MLIFRYFDLFFGSIGLLQPQTFMGLVDLEIFENATLLIHVDTLVASQLDCLKPAIDKIHIQKDIFRLVLNYFLEKNTPYIPTFGNTNYYSEKKLYLIVNSLQSQSEIK